MLHSNVTRKEGTRGVPNGVVAMVLGWPADEESRKDTITLAITHVYSRRIPILNVAAFTISGVERAHEGDGAEMVKFSRMQEDCDSTRNGLEIVALSIIWQFCC